MLQSYLGEKAHLYFDNGTGQICELYNHSFINKMFYKVI